MDNIYVRTPPAACSLPRRGSVGVVHELGWGPVLTPMEFMHADEIGDIYGETAAVLRDALICAERVLCVRPEGSAYAKCMFGRARYPGSGGNMLTVVSSKVRDGYRVDIYLGSRCVAGQTVTGAEELCDDDYIVYDRGCSLFATAGMPLSGGSDAVMTDESYADAVRMISGADVIACGEASAAMAEAMCSRVDELRGGGSYVCGLAADRKSDGGAIYSLYTGGSADAVYYTAGALAACPFYRTVSGHVYAGSADVPVVSVQEAKSLAAAGQISYVRRRGCVMLYREVSSDAKSGGALRLEDELRRRIHDMFEEKYRGRTYTDGSAASRLSDEIKAEIVKIGRVYGCFAPDAVTVSVNVRDGNAAVSVSVPASFRPVEFAFAVRAV